jgi:V8-like Glu-specific endopeptidase
MHRTLDEGRTMPASSSGGRVEGASNQSASARVAVLLCAALASGALLSGVTAPTAKAASGGEPGPNRTDVAEAVAFREKLGLRSDRAFVVTTFSATGFSAQQWGVPLDAAESADVGRRTKVQSDTGSALRAWSNEPEAAGAYLDQHAKGAPVFLTTGDPIRARGKLAKLLPSGANARFLRVRHSMADLLAVQATVDADLQSGGLDGLGVTSTAIDARSNAVEIGVAGDSAEVRSALEARYGDAVDVRLELPAEGGDSGSCTGRDACPPAKGGIKIVSSYNGNYCTVGFLVHVDGSAAPRILTAGHCVVKSGGTGTSRTWTHDGVSMGWAELGYWTDGATADVALINPASGAVSGARNLVYRSSTSDIVPITSYRATAEQVQGGIVCRSGVVSGYHCGTIELTNRTKDVDGHTIEHQWVVDFDACPGDSGGPYLLGSTAYGIHTDSTFGCDPSTNEAWYSPLGWVLSALKARGHPVSLCVTATCAAETGIWTKQAPLDQAAWSPRLITLADGRILQVGGTSGDLLGGPATPTTVRMPEVFDPATGAWSDTASPPWLPATCDGQFAVRLGDGRVLVGGGVEVGSGSTDACDGAQIYDPTAGAKGSWVTAASPPAVPRSAGAVLLADGRAFVTGASGATGSNPEAMAYSPADDTWTTLAAPPAAAIDPLVLGLHDHRVLVSGGYAIADAAPGYTDVTAAALYNPATDSWAATTSVGARGSAGVVLADGRVVVAGGQHLTWNGTQGSSFSSSVSRFDPATNAWTKLSPLRTARAGFTLAQLPNGLLLAAGGRIAATTPAGLPTSSVEGWDPTMQAWYAGPSMLSARADHGAARLGNGTLLVAGGGTTAAESYVAGDIVPPIVAAAPTMSLRAPASMSTSSVPVRLTWGLVSDAGGSGVGTYEVARSTDGGAFTTIASHLTSTSFDTTTARTHTYRFEVRARDWAGNAGAWKAGTTLRINVFEQTSSGVAFAGTWRSLTGTSYSGGSLRSTTVSGASATFTFTGRGVAFVSSRGPDRGSARIYIDGAYAGIVGLYGSAVSYRYVAYQKTWSSAAKHTIKIVAVPRSGRPRIDVDAFEVLSNP